MDCHKDLGNNSIHGELVLISEIINTNSNCPPKITNFLCWIKKFYKATFKMFNVLLKYE